MVINKKTISETIRKKNIAETIKYYNLLWIMLLGIILFFARIPLHYIIYATNDSWMNEKMMEMLWHVFSIGLLFLWGGISFVYVLSKRYTKITGRNFREDHGKYHRSYSELLEYFKDADPCKMDLSSFPIMSWHKSKGFVLGRTEDGHLISFEPGITLGNNGLVTFVWGAPGDGKTSCTIIPSARRWGGLYYSKKTGMFRQGGACMVTDLKGDVYEANKDVRCIKRISTIDYLNSYHVDPLVTARNMNDDDRSIFLDNLAHMQIADEKDSTGAYYVDVARDFFTAIFLYSLHKDDQMGFSEICDSIPLKSYAEWGQEIENSGYIPAIKKCNRFKDEHPRNVGGGYSKLCNCLQLYTSKIMKTLLANDEYCISPEDLENCIDIYIQVDPTEMDLYAPFVAMLYQIFMSAAFKRELGANPPIAYIIDEFGQLPMMPVILKSAQLLRGYNCSLMICTQSKASLDEIYGEYASKIFKDCAKAHVFFSVNDPDTQEWASKLIGSRKELRISNSISSGKEKNGTCTVSEVRERVFYPEIFGLLPDDHSVIIKYLGHYVKCSTCYYLD